MVKARTVQGTILILDGVSTNRIMLKVQLTAAWYRVAQHDRLAGLLPVIRRVRPDLILCAMDLPDGDALDIRAALGAGEALADIPIVAIAAQNDRAARIRALSGGIDDVLNHPYDDTMLLARIRSLLRTHAAAAELRLQGAAHSSGFHEPGCRFARPAARAHVALVTQTAVAGAVWRARLQDRLRHYLAQHRMDDMQGLLSDPVPDAIIVELSGNRTGLNLLADLKARSPTRCAAIIAVTNTNDPQLASEALDRGADDVLPGGFDAQELALRLETCLLRKSRADHLRAQVQDGMRAALQDPLTGLHNRRFIFPELERIARNAEMSGQSFAVLLADLDHFKRINDTFGHAAGDRVLIDAAARLKGQTRPGDLLARVGGEEFLMVLPGLTADAALTAADRLCHSINGKPFDVPGCPSPIAVTASIGLVVMAAGRTDAPHNAQRLFEQADRAMYDAKTAGRNQVSVIAEAA